MDDLCQRFESHVFKLFKKHGIDVVDFWVDAEGNNKVYYLCAFDSIESKNEAWESFQADPEWKMVKAKSEEPGPVVEKVESYVVRRAVFFGK
jgi:hypothetical protein